MAPALGWSLGLHDPSAGDGPTGGRGKAARLGRAQGAAAVGVARVVGGSCRGPGTGWSGRKRSGETEPASAWGGVGAGVRAGAGAGVSGRKRDGGLGGQVAGDSLHRLALDHSTSTPPSCPLGLARVRSTLRGAQGSVSGSASASDRGSGSARASPSAHASVGGREEPEPVHGPKCTLDPLSPRGAAPPPQGVHWDLQGQSFAGASPPETSECSSRGGYMRVQSSTAPHHPMQEEHSPAGSRVGAPFATSGNGDLCLYQGSRGFSCSGSAAGMWTLPADGTVDPSPATSRGCLSPQPATGCFLPCPSTGATSKAHSFLGLSPKARTGGPSPTAGTGSVPPSPGTPQLRTALVRLREHPQASLSPRITGPQNYNMTTSEDYQATRAQESCAQGHPKHFLCARGAVGGSSSGAGAAGYAAASPSLAQPMLALRAAGVTGDSERCGGEELARTEEHRGTAPLVDFLGLEGTCQSSGSASSHHSKWEGEGEREGREREGRGGGAAHGLR